MVIGIIPAGEFKAKCLALLDEVALTGEAAVLRMPLVSSDQRMATPPGVDIWEVPVAGGGPARDRNARARAGDADWCRMPSDRILISNSAGGPCTVLGQLTGVPDELVPRLQDALREAAPEECLAVCLYFLRDLPIEMQTLSRIEADLRKVFPRRADGRTPDDYADFQASRVRFVFNSEKRSRRTPPLFENPARGRWRNTPAGNRLAEAFLDRHGLKQHVASAIESAPQRPSVDTPALAIEEPDDCPETRMELAEFAANASSLIQGLREAGRSLVLTVEGRAVAELLPIYREPPPELAASVLWEAEDAFEPQPELWAALR